MSYARKGLDGSDVYVYATPNGWVCHGCRLAVAGAVHCTDRTEMIDHLRAHETAGHAVPAAAVDRLARERAGEVSGGI